MRVVGMDGCTAVHTAMRGAYPALRCAQDRRIAGFCTTRRKPPLSPPEAEEEEEAGRPRDTRTGAEVGGPDGI